MNTIFDAMLDGAERFHLPRYPDLSPVLRAAAAISDPIVWTHLQLPEHVYPQLVGLRFLHCPPIQIRLPHPDLDDQDIELLVLELNRRTIIPLQEPHPRRLAERMLLQIEARMPSPTVSYSGRA